MVKLFSTSLFCTLFMYFQENILPSIFQVLRVEKEIIAKIIMWVNVHSLFSTTERNTNHYFCLSLNKRKFLYHPKDHKKN